MSDLDKEPKTTTILNEACLIGGEEFKQGADVSKLGKEIITDLRSAGRLCKDEDEADDAKKSAKEADKKSDKDK